MIGDRLGRVRAHALLLQLGRQPPSGVPALPGPCAVLTRKSDLFYNQKSYRAKSYSTVWIANSLTISYDIEIRWRQPVSTEQILPNKGQFDVGNDEL